MDPIVREVATSMGFAVAFGVFCLGLLYAPAPLAADLIVVPDVQGVQAGSGFVIQQAPQRFPPEVLRPWGLPRRDEAEVLSPHSPELEDRVRLVFWPRDEARARRVMDVLDRSFHLPGLPPEVPSRAILFLAPDLEIWNALTGGMVPEWGGGVAIPSRRMAIIPLFGNPWGGLAQRDRTVLHEWAHLGLHDYLDGLRIPRWFDEGYAQWASGGWNTGDGWRLRVALARGHAPPLDSLSLEWPRDRVGAELAYLLSASAVEYLVAESGARGMEVFLERWQASGDFEEAFRRTFGWTTGTFERRWIQHVQQRYGWILLLSHTAAFWLFVGLALLVLIRIRRRRDRERMARMRASDPPDQPAYWEGPPGPPIGGFRSDVERAWVRGDSVPASDPDELDRRAGPG